MAAAMVSISESIQASIIIQRSLSRHQNDQIHSTQEQNKKRIGFFVQVMLVSALFGIEMVVAFEQIYVILFHQFLGVPVSLLSINGIICGVVSMTLLPILGYCSDKGTNPQRRKLFSLFVGMTMYLTGLLLLAVAGFIKLSRLDGLVESKHGTNFSDTSGSTTFSSIQISGLVRISLKDPTTLQDSTSPIYPQQNTTQEHNHESANVSQLASSAILSIIGFSFIDIGFDMSISLTRAFILENVPTFQHTRLLVLATIVASIAGTTFSFIGCFDFPGALGPLFHAEGVAVTLIFFCALLFILIITGFSLTMITGYVISRKSREHAAASCTSYDKIDNSPVTYVDNGVSPQSRRRLTKETVTNRAKHHADRPYVPDILHTEEGDPSTRPLLLENSLKGNSYWAMSISTSSIIRASDLHDSRFTAVEFNPSYLHENTPTDTVSNAKDKDGDSTEALTRPETYDELKNNVDDKFNEHISDNGESSFLEAVRQSYSTSMSIARTPLGEFHARKIESLQNQQLNDSKKDDTKLRMNKRLIILCISCFFTFGGMITFIIYISNALNIGIFHGDPSSVPGTEAYDRYQSGLRTAALGNLVLYVTYMVISINNTRILNLIGEKAQFVVCHLFLIISLLTLILSQRVEVYFVFMVSCGALRTCVFTLPFVLANKFTHDENAPEDKDSDKQSTILGRVMTLIGFLIPAHYIILSIVMGPLMDYTGSVWVPLIYSLCSCSLALIIFIPLFFVKN